MDKKRGGVGALAPPAFPVYGGTGCHGKTAVSQLPKNNSSYLSAVSASHASYLKKTTVSDAKQYYYAGSTPSDPYVYVKSSFSVNGDTSYSIPEKKLTDPIK